jgi:hypothetical protein
VELSVEAFAELVAAAADDGEVVARMKEHLSGKSSP